MSGVVLAVMESGPRLKELFTCLDKCCDEMGGCEFCNQRIECEIYCERHLYNKKELSPGAYQKHMAAVMRRRRIKKRQAGPLCEIEFLKAGHREINLVCGGI